MDNNEIIRKRILELARRSYERGTYEYTGFLSPSEQNIYLSLQNEISYASSMLYSANASGIRKIAVFGSYDRLGYDWEDPIRIICISPRSEKFAEDLTHRDYLGAVLGLGLDRELTGDIIVRGKRAWIFVMETIAEFICGNLRQVRHTDVDCAVVSKDIPELEVRFEELHANIASERADLVIAAITGEGREKAKRLVTAELVFVNGALLSSASHKLKAGDEIVVRGYGKFIYDGIISRSRKDRLNIGLRKYI